MYEGVEVLAPIRKKPGKKLTDAEKASNMVTPGSASWSTPSEKSNVAVIGRYRNPLSTTGFTISSAGW